MGLARIHLREDEYLVALDEAELDWVGVCSRRSRTSREGLDEWRSFDEAHPTPTGEP